MECSDVHEKLSAYLEGIVSSEEKAALEGHLKSCQKCSRTLFELKKTVEYVKNLEEIEPPPWLTQKVMTRVREESEAKKGFLRKLFYPLHIKVPIEVAATIAVAITTFYIFKTIQPEIKPETPVRASKVPSGAISESKTTPSVIARSRERSGETQKQAQQIRRKTKITEDEIAAPSSRNNIYAKQAEQPMPAKKPETVGEAVKAPAAPAPSGKREEVIQYAGASAKDESKREPSKLKASTSGRIEEKISLTINVKDLESANKEIEKHVKELGGKITKTEYFENKIFLTVEIRSDIFKELFEKLKSVGNIREKEIELISTEDFLKIRIDISKI